MMDIPRGPYDIIYADPPWRFNSNSAANPGRNPAAHYPCMKLEEIKALPVPEITANQALLLMWATVPLADKAFEVIEAWGFKYVSQMVWVKDKIGLGYWSRNRHELLYIARKGRFPRPWNAPLRDSVMEYPRREHSRKPPIVADRVDAAWPQARKLEMFARAPRRGWDVWGNQTDKFEGV